MLAPARPSPTRVALSSHARRWLWVVAALDMVAVAWMIAAGRWLDQANTFTAVMTLGGRHLVVLAVAAGAFVLLGGLAVPTHGFTSATRLQLAFITLACGSSAVALAGALSAILLVLTGALVLGFVVRPLARR